MYVTKDWKSNFEFNVEKDLEGKGGQAHKSCECI